MKQQYSVCLLLLITLFGACSNREAEIQIVELKTEMRTNPEGINFTHPRFSWQIKSTLQQIVQTAYRVEVAASPEQLKEKDLLWDSDKTASDQSLFIRYDGLGLQSGKAYFWRVTVWANNGKSYVSDIARWSTALMDPSDWKASWIGLDSQSTLAPAKNNTPYYALSMSEQAETKTTLSARYLRKEFKTSKPIKRAMLYISGLGMNVCYLNGQLVSEDVFAPTPSWYTKRVYYNTYDVTHLLHKEENVLGVILGNGRYYTMRQPGVEHFGFPSLISQLAIEYSDGTDELIVSDTSWRGTDQGPIIANNEFDGEQFDARLTLGAWSEKGYDATGWRQAEQMPNPGGLLSAQKNENLRVMKEIIPISIKETGEGKYLIDMGQNMVGFLHVRLNGKKESPVTMRFAELLKENGSELYVANLRSAEATNSYTPATDGVFSWEPIFTYHGFRYVEIEGVATPPKIDDFIGKVIYDRITTIGHFETSNPLINQLHKNAYWGICGNYRGMPTDCPQRDERMGWLGDRATGALGESFLFDNALLYEKWLLDIEESMNEKGSISVVSPRYWTFYNDDVTWPSAYFYIADMLYRQFGDLEPIKARYPSMKRWVNHLTETQMKDFIMMKDVYGDWCMPPESPELIHSKDPSRKTDGRVLSTTVFYSILQLMQKFALINDEAADAAEYATLAEQIKQGYNQQFFNHEQALYDNNTVTANLLSLQLGLVPEGYEEKVFANIVKKTEEEFDGHVSTGVVGIQHLMRGLTSHGKVDLAYKIATNETYPSWGYMIRHDATTIWELWNGNTADPAMNSGNHVMLLGDLLIWFYEDLAGIKNDPTSVGFKKILMQPSFPKGLTHVKASYNSPYGIIKSDWTREENRFSWTISIPPNTSATIVIPQELGVEVKNIPGVLEVKKSNDSLIITIGSGSYTFHS